MPGRLLHVKDTVREKGLINKEKRNRWISIESELQNVEQNRTIYFLLGGGDLKLKYVCMLDDTSYRILVAEGEIVRAENPKVMIDNIVSDLKSGKIRSYKEYNAKEFYEKYLKEFLSNENLQKMEAGDIESTTTELPNLKQVMEKMKKLNASNGITIQNIGNVKNTTNILGNPMIYDMNLRRFKLLETSRSNKENMGVLTVGMLAVVVVLLAAIAAAVPFKCWFYNRKNKIHSSSKEETPSSKLLSTITLESRGNSII
ncbi:hypothetical protein wNo_02440 [Wolbachia endosymbiont of Drosophila simulans wNo]|uniref:hypothetical protein n=2 Tax=Wolbachia TaxID=953 RepID=UPI0002D24E0B|nr:MULTISPECIES: hypothetical protein [unclassified Wolbachia]AGJ98678.1 hypothetical protein wNo_02440 [Wolbachia endosymbiont of Drosophila simulans wNo]QCB62872.1 hypothetical protein EJA99_04830 [Wolbachia endosymbiont of Drosophila mauritiana]QCB63917.1 hypothetical protein EJB00_04815 [Wolbachia endosymbiont of Drosophila mauritiana]QWE33821.1 Uncharacterized protein WwMa_09400 [Wolbachia endosymbiont of Drosophila simulans]TGB07927.1 hypothetical protein E5C28_00090 [Wolbachia endosymbi